MCIEVCLEVRWYAHLYDAWLAGGVWSGDSVVCLCGEAQKSRAEPFNALALAPFSAASVAAKPTSSPLVFIFLSSGKGGLTCLRASFPSCLQLMHKD